MARTAVTGFIHARALNSSNPNSRQTPKKHIYKPYNLIVFSIQYSYASYIVVHILFRLLLYSKMHWLDTSIARQYIQVTHQRLVLKIIKSVPYKRFPKYRFTHSAAGHSWSRCSCICACVCLINQDTAWEVLVCIFMHGRVIWSMFLLGFRPLKRHTMECI